MDIEEVKLSKMVEVDGYNITVTKEELVALKLILKRFSETFIDKEYLQVLRSTSEAEAYRIVYNMAGLLHNTKTE